VEREERLIARRGLEITNQLTSQLSSDYGLSVFGVADVRKIRRPQTFFPTRRGRKVFSFSWFPFLGGGEGKRIIPPNGGKNG